ncbi:MAG: anthranilate phosphoribosyltransferase [Dehalococcoidia bacterium]|nr:anthranilate phosphoribosyltransferase [Dehalococcoidia bacterium]
MTEQPSPAIREALSLFVEHHDLSEEHAAACMTEMADGTATPAQIGAFLSALRLKGETADELAGMLRVMRERALPVPVAGPLLDTCGTGGDGSGSFNVSTCAAFIAAGAGARVAKHGNRAMSSQCGSADVLEALGARIDLSPESVARCIERSGIGFMFAPAFHPAMKTVAPVRREIGMRTVFNLLGPLTNPAGATRRVVGVARREQVALVAEVLGRSGAEHVLAVHGGDGYDEVSITAPTDIAELAEGAVREYTITTGDVGLPAHEISYLRGGTPQQNAAELRLVLGGAPGPLRDFSLINAAAALVAWGAAPDIAAAVTVAMESIDSGGALAKLDAFIAATNEA